jgi:hypothetical protein
MLLLVVIISSFRMQLLIQMGKRKLSAAAENETRKEAPVFHGKVGFQGICFYVWAIVE